MNDSAETHPVISTIETIVQIFKDFVKLDHEVTRLQEFFSNMTVQVRPSGSGAPQLTDTAEQGSEAVAKELLPVASPRMEMNELPVYIQELIRKKRRARRRAQKTLHPEDRKVYNKLTGDVRVAINEYRTLQVAFKDAVDAIHKFNHKWQAQ